MSPRYELFDHTADLGIRLFAETQQELIPIAAEALYAVIGELVTSSDGRPVAHEFTGGQHVDLLRDFLTKLLSSFETEYTVLRDVTVRTMSNDHLRVEGRSCPIDAARCVDLREVEAITYHALAVKQTKDGYEATIIVDI